MILTMGVALYTSRIVLKVLGASDYGLYNVVGGVVSMFSFLNGSLSAGTSRFITYDLGLGNKERLKEIFNVALVSHIGLASIIFVIAETLGLWFINTQLVFSTGRTVAVNVVYQLSILTLLLQLTQVPFNADIIAHEKMDVYAYVSIMEVSLKLVMVLLLTFNQNIDNLILYSILLFVVQLIIISTYRIYCYRHYEESHWQLCKKTQSYKEIFSFSGWDVIGSICVLSQGQGVNILLNIFFGPVVNAARAISYQIEGAFTQLTSNFMTAVNPQIVKSFASQEYDDMLQLIKDASKYAFFLLAAFLIPLLFKLDYVLEIWLDKVPDHAATFAKIVLVTLLIRVIARPVINGTHATGHIKRLDLYAGGLGLMPLPIIYILLKLGLPAVSAFYIILLWGIFANIVEIVIFKLEMKSFQALDYVWSVYSICIVIGALITGIDYVASGIAPSSKFWIFCLYYSVAVLVNCIVIFFLGFSGNQRKYIAKLVLSKIKNEDY